MVKMMVIRSRVQEVMGSSPTINKNGVISGGVQITAVRQFSGFVNDSNVGEEAAALKASIAGTKWLAAVEKSRKAGQASIYTVAQYNDPFKFDNRVNEIWFLFDYEN
ncbi:unnamed protein product [Lupinus luteus]|uniref:Uncharacterized protein n=1 Tax=Lupinus luteus TaxID=3873 RepID=A0AAV1YI42_LUPLU